MSFLQTEEKGQYPLFGDNALTKSKSSDPSVNGGPGETVAPSCPLPKDSAGDVTCGCEALHGVPVTINNLSLRVDAEPS